MSAPENIAAFLPRVAARRPNEAAVYQPDGRSWTFAELEAESNRIARGLVKAGIGRGVRTALMVPPSLEFFALTFAIFKTGAVPVLIDPGMGLRNLKACLKEAAPEAFIGIGKAHLARILLGWARESCRTVVTVGRRWSFGGLTLDALRDPEGSAFLEETRAQDTAAILFTSGSTGIPKGAVYTHGVFLAQVEMLRRMYGIESGEIDLPTFPLFALFGPALGMTAVIPDMNPTRPAKADPRKLVGAIEHFGVTQMFGSPALLDRLGRYLMENDMKLPTLRRIVSAGAPVPASVLERFSGRLATNAQVYTPYGATESLPVSSIGSDEILKETRAATDQGEGVCVGRPVEGMKARIIRISDDPIEAWSEDLELPAGEIGEIVVRGPVVTREYYRRENSTKLSKIQDPSGGFYHRMGDLGYFDKNGRLWFCGRKAHRVRTAGRTLYTVPCEAVFNTHQSVYRTALVGVPENGASRAVLCVELEPGARQTRRSQIVKELLDLGSKHAHTSGIQTILFHDSFPVDIRHNAKIFREKLAVWAQKRLS